jgi:hypothetical protein
MLLAVTGIVLQGKGPCAPSGALPLLAPVITAKGLSVIISSLLIYTLAQAEDNAAFFAKRRAGQIFLDQLC